MDIFEIAQEIFTTDFKTPQSIQFFIDTVDNNILFEILTLFLLEGIKIKVFNNQDVDFTELDDIDKDKIIESIYVLKPYFYSIGFNFNVKLIDCDKINLKFEKKLSFYSIKEYKYDLCTIYKDKTNNSENNNVMVYYNPFIQAPDLKYLYLYLNTERYVLEITFMHYFQNL